MQSKRLFIKRNVYKRIIIFCVNYNVTTPHFNYLVLGVTYKKLLVIVFLFFFDLIDVYM